MCVTSLLCGPRADLWPFYGFLCKRFSLYTRGKKARQVRLSTRRIRLSFVKCTHSDLRDIFFHNFRGLKWIPL